MYYLSLYIFTLKQTDILCVCQCTPDSLKMGTVGGGGRSWSLLKGCLYEDSLN